MTIGLWVFLFLLGGLLLWISVNYLTSVLAVPAPTTGIATIKLVWYGVRVAAPVGVLVLLPLACWLLPASWLWGIVGLLILAFWIFIQKGWKPALSMVLAVTLLLVVVPHMPWREYLPDWFSGWSSPTTTQRPVTTPECPGKRELALITEEWLDLKGCRLVADTNDLRQLEFADRTKKTLVGGYQTRDVRWVRSPKGNRSVERSLCRDNYRNESLDWDCTPLTQTTQAR